MKTSTLTQFQQTIPTLFRIAALIEDFDSVPAAKPAPAPNETSFADLMLHPEKLEAALENAKSQNDAFDATRKFSLETENNEKQAVSSKKNGVRHCPANRLQPDLKITEFHLEAPFAESVKLAADFTDWEKFPLDMIKSEDGVWYTTVPLPPGHYSYRFIVDGEWCDDPRPIVRLHDNPFGQANAIMEVA